MTPYRNAPFRKPVRRCRCSSEGRCPWHTRMLSWLNSMLTALMMLLWVAIYAIPVWICVALKIAFRDPSASRLDLLLVLIGVFWLVGGLVWHAGLLEGSTPVSWIRKLREERASSFEWVDEEGGE